MFSSYKDDEKKRRTKFYTESFLNNLRFTVTFRINVNNRVFAHTLCFVFKKIDIYLPQIMKNY